MVILDLNRLISVKVGKFLVVVVLIQNLGRPVVHHYPVRFDVVASSLDPVVIKVSRLR